MEPNMFRNDPRYPLWLLIRTTFINQSINQAILFF